jgi:erythromycin esterase
VNRILVAALGALLLLSCGELIEPPPSAPATPSETRSATITWMKQTAIPLSTVEAGHGFADLAPLTPVLAGVRVVGLGESTHGTREFFQLKHRMFEYLVSELGFTVFTIEANFTEAFAVDHYVLTGEGDPARALAGLYFWTWNTEEVLELIRWMRAYNADPAHPRKLRFYGMDSQLSPGPAQALLDYLAQVDPAYRAEAEPWLTRLLSLSELNGGSSDDAMVRAASYITPVQELRTRLEAQRESYVQVRGEEAYVLIARHARTLEHAVVQSSMQGQVRANRRDEFAMENLRWILEREGPGAKMAIWAHNAHLMQANGSFTPTGAHLKAELGDAFYMFRLAFNQGEFRALLIPPNGTSQGLQTHRIDAAPKESFEAVLAATGLPRLALDLRAAPKDGAVARYMDQLVAVREIGAAYTPGYGYLRELRPRTTFDGVLFVETTTASRPNPPLD